MASADEHRGGATTTGAPVLVVMGGPPPWADAVPTDADLVVAVDSGVDHALELGLRIDVVVGDLDSVSADGLAAAGDGGARIEEHPADKDQTDLELALEVALADAPASCVVVGGAPDDRIDHWLAALGTLASPRWRATRLDVRMGRSRILPVHDEVRLPTRPGQTVSLIAIGGDAVGIRSTGVEWPLDGETLPPTVARGVSNVAIADEVTVAVEQGVVLLVVPGPEGA
ncbi:MAG: thiamine diphosphokinase [Actinomycetota bacterium]